MHFIYSARVNVCDTSNLKTLITIKSRLRIIHETRYILISVPVALSLMVENEKIAGISFRVWIAGRFYTADGVL